MSTDLGQSHVADVCQELKAHAESNGVTPHSNGKPARPPDAHITPELIENIPPELRNEKRWVTWAWTWKEDEKHADGGKWDKPPIEPFAGYETSATDPNHWLSFETALKAARSNRRLSGIGVALGDKDNRIGVVGIDLDKCVNADGSIEPWAWAIVQEFNSYTEYTPSGKGLRIWIWGAKFGSKCRTNRRPNIEIYESGRYFTVTGRHVPGTPTAIGRRQAELNSLYWEMFPEDDPSPNFPTLTVQRTATTDDEILDKARTCEKNGAAFSALFDQGDTSAHAGDDSAADLALCNYLAFWLGKDAGRIEKAFSASKLGQRDKWKREDYRKATIGKAIEGCRDVYSPQPPPGKKAKKARDSSALPTTGNGRPQIVVTTEEHEVIDEAISSLKAESNLFQRGGSLVSVLAECKPPPAKAKIAYPVGSLKISSLPNAQIRRLMTVHAEWFKWQKQRIGGFKAVPSHPPAFAVEGVASMGLWEGIRPLEGIVETPTLRPDGSLLDQPGYDAETGLWYAPVGDFPKLPDSPTLYDAQTAVRALLDVIDDFPFASVVDGKNADGTDKIISPYPSSWLAALLTALARFAIDGCVPLFLFDANCPGTGKSKLSDIIAILVTGREMPRGNYPDDQDEMQKMLLSVAMSGDRLLLFDNVTTGFSIGGSALDRAVTARTMKGRILGKSEMTSELPMNVIFFVTGNNLGIKGDALRRVVPCRLETTEERPETRSDFTISKCKCGCGGNLLAHVKINRASLVCSALAILRGYIAAGSPDQKLTPLDFPEWSGLVRSAVKWATGLDPCAGRKVMIADDEETNAHRAVIEGWAEACKGLGQTRATVADAMKEIALGLPSYSGIEAVFRSWSKDGSLPSPKAVGTRLKAYKGRPIDGKAFKSTPLSGTMLWEVIILKP